MEKYFILMGDIIQSRKANSDELWKNFNEIIESAKKQYLEKMQSPLEIKIGDEFQVVLKDISSLFSLLLYLDVYFRYKNINCRFAIGYGDISGNINKQSAYNMIGEGLTNTNQLLNAKKNKFSFYIQDDIEKTTLLNTIGLLLEDSLSGLTTKQIIYLFHKVVEGKTITQIEKEMNTVQRNIYNYRERSKYTLVEKVFKQIINSFDLDEEGLKKEYNNEFKIDF